MNLPSTLRNLGWLIFVIMWIPYGIAILDVVRQRAEGTSDSEFPARGRWSLLIGLLLTGVSVLLLVASPIVSGLANRSVVANGLPAQATVLEIRDTGTTINLGPVVHLVLEVRPPGGPSFQAETEVWIGRLEVPRFQPGSVIPVRYDPETHAVALDRGGSP